MDLVLEFTPFSVGGSNCKVVAMETSFVPKIRKMMKADFGGRIV
jgi:hypothetical protein